MNIKQFIEKARKIHGNKYDYSLVEYKNNRTKIKITCPEHGVFEQTPGNHLQGQRCPDCYGHKKMSFDDFIKRAKKIHKNKYSYEKSVYIRADKKIEITCPKHGSFMQFASNHLLGHGCPACGHENSSTKRTLGTDNFIKEARKIHGNKYDYSLVEYVNNRTKVKIICPKHGVFEQIAGNHLYGRNCPLCAGGKKLTTKEFIIRAKEIHGDKYDYSLTEYKGIETKIKIICPIHGEFLQTPHKHLNAQHGCPSCNESHGEREVARILNERELKFKRQKKWSKCKNENTLPFDFYIPSLNLAIEYDGEQHFVPKQCWGGDEEFKKIKYRDDIKNRFCIDEGIKLLRINYTENIEEKLCDYFDK